jgi:hypothetical protein
MPPPAKIRCFLSTRHIVCRYIVTVLVLALGLGLTIVFALTMESPLSLLGCAAALAGVGVFVFLAAYKDYCWVELEGNSIRAKHIYTRRTIERTINEIESLNTIYYGVRRIETIVIEKLLGRVKGIEIRFRDRRTPMRILRADPAMTNAQELIEALLYRMKQVRELDSDIINLAGQPLIRKIHWKDEKPSVLSNTNWNGIQGCLVGTALMFGTLLCYWGMQEKERLEMASIPPHEIDLRSLIKNGPGANRHVILTDFQPGGYAFESKSGSWSSVWIALFPASARPDECKDIRVVLYSTSVRDEMDLGRLLQNGRVLGMCSADSKSYWGATLGPNLTKANQGCQLSSSWSIEELSEPPSVTLVTRIMNGSAGCFVAVLILAIFVFWKNA